MRLHVRTTGRRTGFTLIELLLVIVIIAILTAITTSAVIKGLNYVDRSNSERTVQKVYERVSTLYEKLRKEAQDVESSSQVTESRLPPARFPFCQRSEDLWDSTRFLGAGTTTPIDRELRRFKVVKLKMLQKWCMPMSYREVRLNVCVSGPLGGEIVSGHPFAVALFRKLWDQAIQVDPAMPPNDPNRFLNRDPQTYEVWANNPYTESGACLALIYSLLGSMDDMSSSELRDTDGDGVLEITDSWGTPLRMYRWPTDHFNPEDVANAPYAQEPLTRVEKAFPSKGKVDKEDEGGLLYDNWQGPTSNSPFGPLYLDVFQGPAPLGPSTTNGPAILWCHRISSGYVAPPRAQPVYAPFVVVSAGSNKRFGLVWADLPVLDTPDWQTWLPPLWRFSNPPLPPNNRTWGWNPNDNTPGGQLNGLRRDPMVIMSPAIPGTIDPQIQSSPVNWRPTFRDGEYDNIYSYRLKLAVAGQ